ncbi:MAG: SGNH/GDSL hydrolase family protein [Acidimicrobiales bacterium]
MIRPPRAWYGAAVGLATLMSAAAACSSAGSENSLPISSAPPSSSATTQAQPPAAPLWYVSIGDSYAAGYQPTGPHSGHTDTNGFAYQVPRLAVAKGYDYRLVNFGCGGATTTSILHSPGCPQLGPGATPYPGQSQAAAAEAFLRSHGGRVGLITVSIGGNDVTSCIAARQPVSCVAAAVKTVKKNLEVLLQGLRQAAGASVPIVGTTYPDVILGLDISKAPALRELAQLSVIAFKDLINPTLKKCYSSVHAEFVDVTAATGAYGSLRQLTELHPYGRVPVPVARVCTLTFFCEYHDIHPRTSGYTIIAKLVLATLPLQHHR